LPLSKASAFALAAASGGLAILASPPHDVWPLAFVSWAPLFLAIHGRSPREAFWLGGARDLVMNALGLAWIPAVTRSFGGLPWIACGAIGALFYLYGAGRTALLAWVVARAERNGWSRNVAVVLALAGTEAVYPLLFPWYSAVQVHGVPLLLQLAELGGPVLVGIPLAMAGLAVAEVAQAALERRGVDARAVSVLLAGPAAMLAFGAVRLRSVEASMAGAPKVEVGFVQANAPVTGLSLPEAISVHREATLRLTNERPLDLVVWPEDALNGALPREAIGPMFEDVTRLSSGTRRLETAILAGATLRRGSELTNSAVLFADGRLRGIYDKMHPLAFGEALPLGDTFPSLYRAIPNASRITPGTKVAGLPLGTHLVLPLICYEDLLADSANRAVAEVDPDLLVNITNDAWFGAGSAAVAHLAFAQFRAVEHRRYLVHAANSGVSAFVDPTGRVLEATPTFEAAARRATLRWMRARTVYETLGEAPWWGAAAMAIAMGLVRRRRGVLGRRSSCAVLGSEAAT
jgi:apolipoprotein N-acyltransferase